MNRPSRMVLVLAIFSIAGLAALGIMAQRYGKMLDRPTKPATTTKPRFRPPEPPRAPDADRVEESARRAVDAFIKVRQAVSNRGQGLAQALEESGLDEVEYAKLDRIYRAWSSGRGDVGTVFREAFDERKEALEGF